MRFLAFLTLSAGAALCADFSTGQAARLVIGQPTFVAQKTDTNADILGAAGGLAYANNMLFVTDANRVSAAPINNRVLVYKNLSSMLPGPLDELAYNRSCPACVGTATVVLGQADFTKKDPALTQTGMRLPTAVASDGTVVAVADTDNNRVLIWRQIPEINGAPADVVLGQSDFTKSAVPKTPAATSLRGPQGVWIQDGRLYVADTSNNRVLIWNSIPTANGQAADIVLGQPDFTTFVQTDLTQTQIKATASSLLNPVAVTSDGTRLYVTDLGHNRVLIWNAIPTRNQQPADVVLGQPDMESAVPNNTTKLCTPTGQDDNGNDIYPLRCNATMDFPRYALSDGGRLFIADGGNDRVLVYSSVPTQNGQGADAILGQFSDTLNSASDSGDPLRRASADSLRTPLSLAWDGMNLYASDPFNRRVMVFTLAEKAIPLTGVRNAASFQIFAVGAITFSGEIKENDEVTITIADKEYKYKIVAADTIDSVINKIVALINEGEGDPNVFASPNTVLGAILLTARKEGSDGDAIEYTATPNAGGVIVVRTVGARLDGGGDAAKVAPGTLVTIVGDGLSEQTASGEMDTEGRLPLKLGGVRVYFNGIHAPLLYVSPKQINAQVPFEALAEAQNCDAVAGTYKVSECQSLSAYVRTEWSDGRVTITNPVAVSIIPQNPGIFTEGGQDPRPAVALHFSSFATGTISVDGSVAAGDTATVKIEDREYKYTVKAEDTLATIRDGLIELINIDPKVRAFPAGQFTRIRLQAREPGEAGVGIKYSVSTNSGAKVILSPTTEALCCANVAGSLVTAENPLLPGETLVLYATGLGLIKPEEARKQIVTGQAYNGPELNEPVEFLSSLCGSKTANVLYAGLKQGMVGVYEIHLELNSDIPTNPRTQCTIAQDVYVSNIATIPVVNPKEEE
jgi:uncharacterized protein (TIGR03437 family)